MEAYRHFLPLMEAVKTDHPPIDHIPHPIENKDLSKNYKRLKINQLSIGVLKLYQVRLLQLILHAQKELVFR